MPENAGRWYTSNRRCPGDLDAFAFVCLPLSLSLITQPEKAASKAYLARSLGLSFGDTLSEGEKGHEHRIRECMKRVTEIKRGEMDRREKC